MTDKPQSPGWLARLRGRMLRRWPMRAPLVFDVGANLGQDSRYYLDKGFNVIAIEADPALCEKLRSRFADEIALDRLRVVEVGVGEEPGILPFYVNEFSEWSSFNPDTKATKELEHQVMHLPVVPLSELIARHGRPYYLKLDIEEFELAAVTGLGTGPRPPPYMSFEINRHWQAILERLAGLGYSGFQLIRQGKDFLPRPPSPAREGATHVTRFTNAHSGPFGRDLPDTWLPPAAIEAHVQAALTEARQRVNAGEKHGWFDLHARHAKAPR
ncbi:MAG: FkbM family methyltransferase [Pararhodobacter sp.]